MQTNNTHNRILNKELDENELDINIRPNSLDSFVGQTKIKDNLRVFLKASKLRDENIDHILFYGPPGLGKTTLAQIIATEMGSNIKYMSGPAITKSGDLAAMLSNLEYKDILFIDEIHRLPIAVEEILYSAMEDFKIDFVVGEGPTARSMRIDLPKFTLVGATTRYGLLSSPLRDRFGITLQLDFYSFIELQDILQRSAKVLNIELSEDGAIEIAKRSRGTPRIANRILKRVRDFLTISNQTSIDKKLADRSLLQLGIDSYGLDDLDRKYLNSIVKFYNGGPVGIDNLATILSESRDTIEDTIEPYLIQNGYIARTKSGRVIAKAGWEYLGLKPINQSLLD
jgi:Holliday junction DNA helicase RuvB